MSSPNAVMDRRARMILWASLALVVGFVAGFAVAILKGERNLNSPPMLMTTPSPLATPPPSIEDTEKIEELKEDLRQNPADHRSWLRLGNLYSKNGQVPPAVDAFRHYLALKPGDSEIWSKLGNLLRRSGDAAGAAEAFRKAAEGNPSSRGRP